MQINCTSGPCLVYTLADPQREHTRPNLRKGMCVFPTNNAVLSKAIVKCVWETEHRRTDLERLVEA